MSYEVIKSWVTKAGLNAYVLLVNDGSHHCGYVEVPGAISSYNFTGYNGEGESVDIYVHGGVTFQEIPEWSNGKVVIGFDCAHAGDKMNCPKKLIGTGMEDSFMYRNGVWRDEEYCVNECESMAEQLINLVPKVN
jgi:hypothetical protein